VRVVIGPGAHPNTVWNLLERPTPEANPAVTQIDALMSPPGLGRHFSEGLDGSIHKREDKELMIDPIKSQAVIAYSGINRSPVPVGDIEAVHSIDVPEAEDLARYVQGVVHDIFGQFPLDWGERNNLEPERVMQLIESAVMERYPELSTEAGAALAWMWSYSSWK
jgi:hypothetical protein